MFNHETILGLYAQARRNDDLAPQRVKASRSIGSRSVRLRRLLARPRLAHPGVGPRPVAAAATVRTHPRH